MSNRRNRRGAARAPAAPAFDARSICANASCVPVIDAFKKLGPIASLGDALDQKGAQDASVTLAGAQVSHLLEALRYFGAALNAHLTNSPSGAVHFAYYAQLRAAMSVFAASGIFCKMDSCFYVTDSGVRTPFAGPPTHTLVWSLWKKWIKTDGASDLLSERVQLLAGVNLSSIVSFPGAAGALDKWGYDLAQGIDDRTARNTASYESKSEFPLSVMGVDNIELVKSIWRLLETDGVSIRFDSAFISYLLMSHFRGMQQDANDPGSVAAVDQLIATLVAGVAAATGVSAESIQERLGRVTENDEMFALAAERAQEPDNVIARALFLVRIALLAMDRALSSDAAAHQACRTWIRNWLETLGVLPDPDEEFSIEDLSDDYANALEQMESFPPASIPRDLWGETLASVTARLTRVEGVCAWALPL